MVRFHPALPVERHLQQTSYFQLGEKNACLEIRSLVEPGLIRLIWDQKIARSNRAAPTKVKVIYILVDINTDRCTDIASIFATSVGIRYVVET